MTGLVFDASSIINLSNGDGLSKVLQLEGIAFSAGPLVVEECLGRISELNHAMETGLVQRLDDSVISAETFIALRTQYRLGDGETECLAFAKHMRDLSVCTDDKAARKVAASVIGAGRVMGSLYLLRECVRQSILKKPDAAIIYGNMRLRGAFLPPLPANYFDS